MSAAAPPPAISATTRWSRDVLFHVAGLLTANIGLMLWTTGLALSLGSRSRSSG